MKGVIGERSELVKGIGVPRSTSKSRELQSQ
jgi:hypothetical protein